MFSNIFSKIFLVVTALFLNACSFTPIESAGYHAAMREDLQAIEILDLEHTKNPALMVGAYSSPRICRSYFKLRRFDRAGECNESLIGKMPEDYSEDSAMEDSFSGRGKRFWFGAYYSMKAALALEFGEYALAHEHAGKAVRFNRSDLDEPESQIIGLRESAELLANAAIAANIAGNRTQAVKYIALIPELEVGFGSIELPKDRREKNYQQARAWMAMADYDKASEALDLSLGGQGGFIRVMAAIGSIGMTELMGVGEEATNPWHMKTFFMRTRICYLKRDYKCAAEGYDSMITGDYGDRLDHLLGELENEARKKALLIARPGIQVIAFTDRGNIAREQGDRDLALKMFSKAIDIIEAQRATINTEASKIGFVGDKERVYRDIVSLLVEMERFETAFIYAERAKARALIDTLASRRQLGNDTGSQRILESLAKAEQQYTSSEHSGGSKQRSASRALIRKKQQALVDTRPELASLVTVSAPSLSDLQALLPVDETLVEYYGHDDELYAFVLSRRGVGAVKLDARDLAGEINAFRQSLADAGDGSYLRIAESLYRKLIRPIESKFGTRSLTIVPHGSMHYLPFNALMSDGKFLIDRYKIRVLPSASVMRFIHKRSQASQDLLALGNPDVGDPSFDLPGAQAEARAVVKAFGNASLLLRGEATETAVKQSGGNYRRLHFASHGIFDSEKPLASSLMLAPDEHNDGLLTVGELYDLKLNADLVTLSACETALGKVANGDDVVGFTRGFLYAGANSIVSSLWKVDDAATNKLMQRFYHELHKGDKRQALRIAQLSVRETQGHPYYWAAFQLTGAIK
jgi:CHAT domain-containing protein